MVKKTRKKRKMKRKNVLKKNFLTNLEIEDFLFPLMNHFIGVFSCDTLPWRDINRPQFSLVCNMSPAGEKGSHFIAIYAEKSVIIYFDSFGTPPILNKFIFNFLVKTKRKILYNENWIQHPLSSACGYFCIYFLLYFEKINLVEKNSVIINKFYSHEEGKNMNYLQKNDVICKKMIRKIVTL